MKTILLVALAVVVLAFLIFPEFRKKLKVLVGGFLNVFVEDAAKTPEGANAVFNQAIEEKQQQYNRAAATLNKLSGELKHAENAAENLTREIADAEATCERLVKNNQMKDAEIFAAKRNDLVAELEQQNKRIEQLRPMVADAAQIHETVGMNLRALKSKKKQTVDELRLNGQMKELLGDLDELKKDTATDKMLDAVLDGSKDLQKEVDGARVVHENRTSTKVAHAEQKAAQLKNDEYLENLKKKYGGNK